MRCDPDPGASKDGASMCRAMNGYDDNEVLLTDCLQMGSADTIFSIGDSGDSWICEEAPHLKGHLIVRTDNVLKLIIIIDPLV